VAATRRRKCLEFVYLTRRRPGRVLLLRYHRAFLRRPDKTISVRLRRLRITSGFDRGGRAGHVGPLTVIRSVIKRGRPCPFTTNMERNRRATALFGWWWAWGERLDSFLFRRTTVVAGDFGNAISPVTETTSK